jgi:hypothetical protein
MIKRVEHLPPELEVVSSVGTDVMVLEKGKIAAGIAQVPNVGEVHRSNSPRKFGEHPALNSGAASPKRGAARSQ